MFEGKNHVHAMTTAFGALGGFAPAPAWWTDAAQNGLVQILALTVLVYQGGGGLDWTYSLAVAVCFTVLVKLTSSLEVGGVTAGAAVGAAADAAQGAADSATDAVAGKEEVPPPPTEYYHNY
tara:strand:- start:2050 stop:2415 length:366 start_codon:yes stop_codon:yes gene_type:complete